MTSNFYDILGVSGAASDADIKNAYHKLALRFHPDRNPDDRQRAEIRFRLINEAYNQLKTTERRDRYNRYLQTHGITVPKAHNDNQGKGWLTPIVHLFWPELKASQDKTQAR